MFARHLCIIASNETVCLTVYMVYATRLGRGRKLMYLTHVFSNAAPAPAGVFQFINSFTKFTMSTHESGARRPNMIVVDGMPVFGALAADIMANGPVESSDGQGAETDVQTPSETAGQVGVAAVLDALRRRDLRSHVVPAEKKLPADHITPLATKRPLYDPGNHAY